MTDTINHPPHYVGNNGIEAIDVIEGFDLGHHLGAAVAYILRANRKGEPIKDLKKAAYYIAREINRRENGALKVTLEKRARLGQ
jgi:Protein of unknwon function (DUF3310)